MKYDKDNYEFKKPSGIIQSKIYRTINRKQQHYNLNPIQFDILNLMMYNVKKRLMTRFGSTKKLIEVIQNDYETFEQIIDTDWYELSWREMHDFTNRLEKNHKHISDSLEELTEVKIKTNIFDKNKNLGQTTFSLVRKFTTFKNKIKYKLEPELFQMILLHHPVTDELYAVLRLKIQAQHLKTVGAKRLYEFMKDWEFKKKIPVNLSDLKTVMNINESVKNNKIYATFNRDHLKKAVNEINSKTDIKVTYTPIKESVDGKRKQVTKIEFRIEKQPKERLEELGLVEQESELSLEDQILYKKKEAIALERLEKSKKFETIENEEAWLKKTISNITDEEVEKIDKMNSAKESLDSMDISDYKDELYEQYGDWVTMENYRLILLFDSENILTKNAIETLAILQGLKS